MEYGVGPFLMSIALKLIPTRDDSYSGLESLTLIALSYNPKPSFVEHLQQCDDPCRVGFYALAFLQIP